METSSSTGKVVGALFIGALAGAALGILFAPDKGSRTRRKLAIGAKDLTEDLTEKIKEEANTLRSKAEELEDAAQDMIADLKTSFRQKVNGVKHSDSEKR